MLGTTLVLHGVACLLSHLAFRETSWLTQRADKDGDDPDSYSDAGVYLRALYWTMDTASTRGNGDFMGRNPHPSRARGR